MITAAWNVQNEQDFIGYSILSVKDIATEIVIVDHGSTDNTMKIVERIEKEFDLNVMKYNLDLKKDEVAGKNMKIDKSTQAWILCMDGDEVYSDGDAAKIIKVIEERGERFLGFRVSAYEHIKDMDTITLKNRKNRPRIFRNNNKTKYTGTWGNDKVVTDDIFHAESPLWDNTDIFFHHYSRLKHSVEERKEKLCQYMRSRNKNMTKKEIYEQFIDNKEHHYYNESRNLLQSKRFEGQKPEVFERYKLW